MASDARSTSPGAQHAYVQSQSHLLKATSDNPLPTAVPPPIAAVAGLLGVRHVLCLIGLPERGKPFIAQRLSKYLSFFHGAEVKLFDVNEVMDRAGGPPGSDHNAMFMFEEIKAFMNATSSAADRNMTVPRAGSGRSAPASSSSPPSPEVRPVVVREGSAEVQLAESLATHGEEELLVHPSDRRRKNVDSGKVAILFANDTFACFKEKWSGTSKERRRWASETLAKDRALGAKLIFIEVIVDRADILEANLRARERAKNGPTASRESAGPAMYEDELPDECLREFEDRARRFQRIYVSMQEDGSEDDLSYIKLINYGDKVVTNRMHGYLRMRIAQFLSVIHPTPHVIYLSRHGQSEYNVLGKLGGNPPLSPAGQEYARRLAQWVPRHIFYQHGVLTKCRLWTSSLQRTILTATHIPHPIVPASSFDSPDGLPSPPAKRSAPLEAAATPLAASRVGISSPPRRGSHETDAATPSGGTPSHRFRSRQRSRQLPPRYLQGDEGVLNEPVWEQMSRVLCPEPRWGGARRGRSRRRGRAV
uniref:6-phosphofructo-2-kinase domain-containing protein n=1 Tax=Emiliania huxleyi TaxID=2903 RepID=A0A7S3T8B4_EMIHU